MLVNNVLPQHKAFSAHVTSARTFTVHTQQSLSMPPLLALCRGRGMLHEILSCSNLQHLGALGICLLCRRWSATPRGGAW